MQESILITIDNFINPPLLVSAIIALLIVVFCIIIKLRNTANISFIYFISPLVLIAGSIISMIKGPNFYFVASLIISELLLIPLLVVKAFDNPKKREAKKAAKLLADRENSIATNELAQAAIAEILTFKLRKAVNETV